LKRVFARFWKRNKAFFWLAVVSNLEYRFNYFTDAILQPVVSAVIELTLWYAVFRLAATQLFGGYPLENYLAYALWAPFVARITSNWMYEFRMTAEIEFGTINGLLVRPISFFECYLSQLLGYKVVTTAISLVVPISVCLFLDLPIFFSRVPIALTLIIYYVIFIYLLSFIITTIAFHLTKTHSLTVAKNLGLWILSGELVPLDLLPEPYRTWILHLPFANAVYIPVGYLTGRVPESLLWQGFYSTTLGLIVLGAASFFLWKVGLRKYVGTGA
jgi:ABC-2 type transport system permease protein